MKGANHQNVAPNCLMHSSHFVPDYDLLDDDAIVGDVSGNDVEDYGYYDGNDNGDCDDYDFVDNGDDANVSGDHYRDDNGSD